MQNLKNQQVVADFFGQGYRLSGALQVSTRLFSDIIYDSNTDYLAILQAYLSPITDPARIDAHYKSTTLNKANVDFVLTLKRKDGLRRDQQYNMRTNTFDLCLTVPFF